MRSTRVARSSRVGSTRRFSTTSERGNRSLLAASACVTSGARTAPAPSAQKKSASIIGLEPPTDPEVHALRQTFRSVVVADLEVGLQHQVLHREERDAERDFVLLA